MTAVELLKAESDLAYAELLTALDGVTEEQAWAILPNLGPDYLHTDASIHGIALHIASCKFMYGSIGFRHTEIRWRECADRIETFEPSWAPALTYLEESQKYWKASWENLFDSQLEEEFPHFSGKTWPARKLIRTVTQHDIYHAGQIAVIRYGIGESDKPPLSVAEDIRKYCAELPDW